MKPPLNPDGQWPRTVAKYVRRYCPSGFRGRTSTSRLHRAAKMYARKLLLYIIFISSRICRESQLQQQHQQTEEEEKKDWCGGGAELQTAISSYRKPLPWSLFQPQQVVPSPSFYLFSLLLLGFN